ncbi:MAG: ABC transporter ATP-binding protein [Planctomycetes bacterium]|nr:ABC transporter ATP-binding protein [Planctomycetota bacterium]
MDFLAWHASARVAPAVAAWFPGLGAFCAVAGLLAIVGGVLAGGLAIVPPHRATAQGIARTFQNIRLFPEMTAIENVMVGMHCRTRSNSWQVFGAALVGLALGGWLAWAGAGRLGAAWWPAWTLFGAVAVTLALWFHLTARRRDCGLAARALELLRFVGVERHAESWARNLPYGDQRRLEIARALATAPKLLLLDEPAAGMNPQESQTLMDLIRKIRDTGITVLLIEHHMKVVMGISDWVVVLDSGKKLTEGEPAKIQNDPQVIEAYLGREEDLE